MVLSDVSTVPSLQVDLVPFLFRAAATSMVGRRNSGGTGGVVIVYLGYLDSEDGPPRCLACLCKIVGLLELNIDKKTGQELRGLKYYAKEIKITRFPNGGQGAGIEVQCPTERTMV